MLYDSYTIVIVGDRMKLKNIFVGDPDGLLEARQDKFANYFYNKNKKYEELKENKNKFIVTGRKGTGKTLLAKYYEKQVQNEGIVSEYIDKEKVLFCQLQSIGNGEIPARERGTFITYAILNEIAKLICKNKGNILKKVTIFRRFHVRRMIRELQNRIDKDSLLNFEKSSYNNSISSTLEGKLKAKATDSEVKSAISENVEETYMKSPYYRNVEEMKKEIFALLNYCPITIIIDDLDEYDEKVKINNNFAKFLSKFIEITYKLNIEIQEISNVSKIILLFRSDLFGFLHNQSTNLNKYVVNSQVILNWLKNSNTSQPEQHILMDMIFNKMRNSCPDLAQKSNLELFTQLFPKKIKGKEPLKYLLNFSHGRPRDIVNLLNKIISKYPEEQCFTNEMFIDVEQEYSKNFCNELRNEMSLYYDSEYITSCFDVLKLIRKNNFKKEDAAAIISNCKNQLPGITNVEDVLTTLFKYGIIGNMKKIGENDIKYYFGYREDGSDIINFNEKFTVHFAVRKALL